MANKPIKKRMSRKEKKEALARMKLVATGVIVKRPIVVVIAQMMNVDTGKEYAGVGWSKVCGDDAWRPKFGEKIALGKAIHHVAEQICKVYNADKFTLFLADLFVQHDLDELRDEFDGGFKLTLAPVTAQDIEETSD